MSQEIVKFEVNTAISFENSSDVKEEFQDEYYPDNKVWVSETAITDTFNIGKAEMNEYMRNDKIEKCETLSVDLIKTDLPSSELNNTVSNNVKREVGICLPDIQIELCNEMLFCNHCHEVYQDYCTKCRVLVHILNKRPSCITYNRVRELPKNILETRELIGHLGIFSLKVIPENVRFGPFTGFDSRGLSLRIKGGRFVVSNYKSEHLNWMQYINSAKNVDEQNLFPLQYEDKLYYCSTRRIQEGEELLVYFGEEYEDNLLENMEMDFIPITKQDIENVFGCTFCCLGFSSKEYLAEHKAVSHGETNEMLSVEELAQCPFCKIYLEANEYFEHHKDYCCETNIRHCVLRTVEYHKLEVKRRSFLRSKVKRWKHGIYKCTQCEFRTMYNADFRHHTNEHCEVKMYKCAICHRRYKTKESLKAHVEKIHADNEGRDIQKYSTSDHFKANIKNMKERSLQSPDGEKQCRTSKRKFQTRDKLKTLIRIKHLNPNKYKCENCDFKTYYRSYLERHMKINHLVECIYKCAECEFETNYKSSLDRHIKVKHLNENTYKCPECEYRTNRQSYLRVHVKTNHLKEHDYKCMECEFKTNYKSHLKVHFKGKHLKEKNYKCTECEFKTNYKSSLKVHIRAQHLKENKYKCMLCEYQTYNKTNLKVHVKSNHLKEHDYKCIECEYMTNHKSVLERHVKAKHLNERNYKCLECEYKANSKSNLKLHVKANHLKEHDYKCVECEYMTNRKSDLERHKNGKHLKKNNYKCAECKFKTYYKSVLEKHIKAKHLKQKGL